MAAENGVQQALAQQLASLKPGTPRYVVVEAARKFKDSWVELGEHLTRVRANHAYKGWGFASFAAYCKSELHLRQETADKLTRSYGYLRERAPTVLEASPEAKQALPPLDVVDLLSQAKARTKVSDEAWGALEGEVLQGESIASRAALRRRLKEVDPEGYGAGAGGAAAAAGETTAKDKPALKPLPVDAHNLRKVLLLAERLEQLLGAMAQGLQGDILQQAGSIAEALRARLAEAPPPQARQLPNDGQMH